MTTLRPYQRNALDQVNAHHESGTRRVVCVVPTGGGKSIIGREWVSGHVSRGHKVLMVAHRIELLKQFAGHASRGGIRSTIMAPGENYDPTAPLICASVDTINARGEMPRADAILWDECFPAGTLVDGTPIEFVKVGDRVASVDHETGMVRLSTVTRTMEKTAVSLVKLTCGDTELTCTGNHPIFVRGRGYVEAKDIQAGEVLCLRRDFRLRGGERSEGTGDLREGLPVAALVGNYEAHQPRARRGAVEAHEGTKPDDERRDAEEVISIPESNGTQAADPWGERYGADSRGASNRERSRMETERGSSDLHDARDRYPNELQAGRGEREIEGGDRSGRIEPLRDVTSTSGSQEGELVTWAGVDRVESVEPSSPGGDRVYNLEVAGSHTYFANGVLVHNCHHAVASTYSPVIESLPGASVLGLTATPQRGDGKPLGDLFDALVVGAQYSELLRDGHLVKCRVLRPEEHLGSDFARDPVEAWCEHARGKRGFIFARSVEESKRIAEGLNAQGIRAANVDGKMSAFERADRMKRFASGHLDVLTNVHVLTEGVDVPGAEVCMLARASQATGTYLQMVGRVLRPAPGKTSALLIDLPGASFVHGIPTADREYSLTGRSIKVTGESLRLCPECGNTQPSALRACEVCNYEWPRKKYEGPKIWNMALVEYIETAGDGTAASLADAPKDLKRAEWNRLLEVGRSRGFGASWAVKEWRKVFEGAEPHKDWLKEIGTEERVSELRKLLRVQRSRGLKLGWISHAYRAAFGAFPSRSLRESAGVPVPEREM